VILEKMNDEQDGKKHAGLIEVELVLKKRKRKE
jgi:hypothetical protein